MQFQENELTDEQDRKTEKPYFIQYFGLLLGVQKFENAE